MVDQLAPLYEDNHLLILDKPAGWLTQPSGTEQQSLESAAKAWIKAVHHKPGRVFLEAVHRLDKPVSGIVVFCKTSKALSRMNESMRDKEVEKIYWAWVEGIPQHREGILDHYLFHDEHCACIVSEHHQGAKRARLHYRLLKQEGSFSLLEITLETGRYHQIRAQLAAMGWPIKGDKKYGAAGELEGGGIALHHRKISFPHPITRQLLTIESKI